MDEVWIIKPGQGVEGLTGPSRVAGVGGLAGEECALIGPRIWERPSVKGTSPACRRKGRAPIVAPWGWPYSDSCVLGPWTT